MTLVELLTILQADAAAGLYLENPRGDTRDRRHLMRPEGRRWAPGEHHVYCPERDLGDGYSTFQGTALIFPE